MTAAIGAGPLAVARAQRAQGARLLLETTDLQMTDVAFAAGFGSIRQFNDTIREVFALTPTDLRRRSRAGTPAVPGAISVRLPFRAPLWPDSLFGHLVATAVPGVEEWRDGSYRRTLRLPSGPGTATLTPRTDGIGCKLRLADMRDIPVAIARCRRLLDLDADPAAVDAALAADPVLAPLVAAAPGRRVPRTVDPSEMALRAVLGQQVSTSAARTHAGRLVRALGEPVSDPDGGLTHLFPLAGAVAGVDPATLALPRSRRAALLGLAGALDAGTVDLGPGADRTEARAAVAALPGLGRWTVDTISLRALGDPDAFLATDLGVRRVAAALGLPTTPSALTAHAQRWRPWRAYAVQYLWGAGDHSVNHLPEPEAAIA